MAGKARWLAVFPLAAALLTAPIWSTALRLNLTNLALLRYTPDLTRTVAPTCVDSATGSQPVYSTQREGLSKARSAAAGGHCYEAMRIVNGISGADSARLKAQLLIGLNQPAQAEQVMAQITTDATAAAWLARIGAREREQGDYQHAVDAFAVAESLSPLSWQQSYDYATSLLELGRIEQGVAVMHQAVRRGPDEPGVHDALSEVLWREAPGSSEAVAEEERAVALLDYSPYRARLGSYYRYLGRLADARDQWRRVLEIGVDRFDALYQLGGIAEESGNIADATRYYAGALAVLDRSDVRASLVRVCQVTSC